MFTLLVSTIIGLLTLIVVLVLVLPRVAVTAADPINPNDPISSTFTITNKNFIPLRHVTVFITVEEIQPVDALIVHDNVPSDWSGHSLNLNDKFSIAPAEVFRFKETTGATIAVVVGYHTWIFPFVREKVFRFTTNRDINGNVHWVPRS